MPSKWPDIVSAQYMLIKDYMCEWVDGWMGRGKGCQIIIHTSLGPKLILCYNLGL